VSGRLTFTRSTSSFTQTRNGVTAGPRGYCVSLPWAPVERYDPSIVAAMGRQLSARVPAADLYAHIEISGSETEAAVPVTLLALLLTIAHVWKQDAIAANAREIANEGRELHKRIADLSRHMAKLGRALESALKTYNGAVGSFDSRLLPAARRFEELKASAVDVQLDPLAEVEVLPRLPRPAGDEGLPDDAN